MFNPQAANEDGESELEMGLWYGKIEIGPVTVQKGDSVNLLRTRNLELRIQRVVHGVDGKVQRTTHRPTSDTGRSVYYRRNAIWGRQHYPLTELQLTGYVSHSEMDAESEGEVPEKGGKKVYAKGKAPPTNK